MKIVLSLFYIMFISACHTLQHNGFELNPLNELTTNIETNNKIINNDQNKLIPDKENTSNKRIKKTKEIIKKTSVKPTTNKVKKTNEDKFNPESILNLSEKQLFKKMGKSNFVKHEGKLKNHQYYFPNCFIDIFAIKKEDGYFVDLFQKRPIKLNGFLNEKSCFKDISKKIKSLK